MTQKKKKIRLLVVDNECREDTEGYYSQLREIADLCGHIYDITCNFTPSGKEALKLISTWEPSIIMVDAHLADVNGSEIVKSGASNAVPVIVTSDFRSSEIEESAKNQGASAYIPKVENPDDFEGLLHKIAFIAEDDPGHKH